MSSDNILYRFGKTVQRLRTERNISQEKFAELAGVHRTYIGMIERAERNITLINIEKIAKAFDLSVPELINKMEK